MACNCGKEWETGLACSLQDTYMTRTISYTVERALESPHIWECVGGNKIMALMNHLRYNDVLILISHTEWSLLIQWNLHEIGDI